MLLICEFQFQFLRIKAWKANLELPTCLSLSSCFLVFNTTSTLTAQPETVHLGPGPWTLQFQLQPNQPPRCACTHACQIWPARDLGTKHSWCVAPQTGHGLVPMLWSVHLEDAGKACIRHSHLGWQHCPNTKNWLGVFCHSASWWHHCSVDSLQTWWTLPLLFQLQMHQVWAFMSALSLCGDTANDNMAHPLQHEPTPPPAKPTQLTAPAPASLVSEQEQLTMPPPLLHALAQVPRVNID